jgi:alkanesulfonate monooxygenase SsuD/methylene tetrahydromethanopterin reductase-like flavin-dependent oxidoreductase (luciferase family)
MAAACLQALAPGREVLIGVGVSSPVVAGDWHGAGYPARPLARMREFIALLRECLSGRKVTFAGEYYQVRNFRLGVELGGRRPKVIVGALGAGMLRLAGELADGVLLNYLPASHVPWCVEQVRLGGNARIYANVHVGVGDRAAAAPRARYDLFSYVVVDAYARSFAQAGFGAAVQAVRAAHQAGDRAAALAAVTDEMVDAINVTGDQALVAATVGNYRRAGVDVPIIFPLTWARRATTRWSRHCAQRSRRQHAMPTGPDHGHGRRPASLAGEACPRPAQAVGDVARFRVRPRPAVTLRASPRCGNAAPRRPGQPASTPRSGISRPPTLRPCCPTRPPASSRCTGTTARWPPWPPSSPAPTAPPSWAC